jgi:hypothetical protein
MVNEFETPTARTAFNAEIICLGISAGKTFGANPLNSDRQNDGKMARIKELIG